ncbi:hypothetical protein NDU88_001843 [Pleurodeles waltl]|uniref:Uncharacterized protein n=1 Tax=Pleurodeles waltl TaxID=8319 RepID=A0AAV7S956_PLEWA|nr:hypothetical protein NDU88_001843 [Pleurodeles waltl]
MFDAPAGSCRDRPGEVLVIYSSKRRRLVTVVQGRDTSRNGEKVVPLTHWERPTNWPPEKLLLDPGLPIYGNAATAQSVLAPKVPKAQSERPFPYHNSQLLAQDTAWVFRDQYWRPRGYPPVSKQSATCHRTERADTDHGQGQGCSPATGEYRQVHQAHLREERWWG